MRIEGIQSADRVNPRQGYGGQQRRQERPPEEEPQVQHEPASSPQQSEREGLGQHIDITV
jgi:hypothetical protein